MKKLFVTFLFAGILSFIPSSLFAQIPSNGLVAWYPFNGNANDESGNGNNGTVNGAALTSDRNGNANSAYSFDGVNNCVRVSDNGGNSLDLENDYTISSWVNLNAHVYSPCIITKHLGNIDNMGTYTFLLQNQSANYPYHILQQATPHFDASTETTVPQNFSLNQWYYLATTYNKSAQTLTHYINGQPVDTISVLYNIQNTDIDLLIGASFIWDMSNMGYFFNGQIDDVGIWNRSLTPQEIQALYLSGQAPCTPVSNSISATIIQDQSYTLGAQTLTTAGTYTEVFTSVAGCDSTVTLTLSVEPLLTCNITTPTTTLCAGQSAVLTMNTTGGASSQLPANLQQGLVAYYPFNGNANDESGNGNHPSVTTIQYTSDQKGNDSSAGLFTGSEYAIVPNNNSFQINGDFSIAYSIYLGLDFPWSGWWNTKAIFTKDNDYPYGAKVFITPDGDSLSIYFGTNMWDATQSFGKKIHRNDLLGSWHHFTWTYSNNFGKLYLDGNLILVQTSNPNWGSANNLDLHIAVNGNPAGNYPYKFVGKMDNLGFWSRALSLSEVQSLVLQNGYSWSTNATTPTITVSPTNTTTYSCTVTSGTQTCTASVDITVNPAITNAVSATIVEGQSYTLGTQTLSTAGTYTEVFTSAAGCDSTVTLTLAVEPLLTCNITTPTTTLCAGQSATLTMNTTGGAGASSQLPANLQQGLVAYYPFNGNANDESGNGHIGTPVNVTLVADRFNNPNSAYEFGLNKWVQISNDTEFLVGHSTISAWVKINGPAVPDGYGNFGYPIFYKGEYETVYFDATRFHIKQNSGCMAYTGNGWVPNSSESFYEYQDNDWHFVLGTFDGSSIRFYVDGTLVQNTPTALNQIDICSQQGEGFKIGKHHNLSSMYFNGSIDEVKFWNRALNDVEISQLLISQTYTWSNSATTPTITVSPTADTTYTCTVTQGNQTCTASVEITVNPVISNALSATIVEGQSYTLGSQTLTTAGTYTEVFTTSAGCDSTVTLTLAVEPLLTCEITSNSTSVCSGEELILSMNSNAADIVNVGQSTFNGQGYIQFPNAGLTGSSSRTISYRAKTSSQNIMSVLNYGGAPNNATGLVELGMNLDMWFGAGSGYCDSITKGVSFFSNSHSVNIGKTIFDNEWHTVTYVMGENNNSSFSSIKVYVDGILVSQGQNNTPFCGHNWGGWTYNTIDGPVTIGKPSSFNPYAAKFVGSIADVGMWSRALTSVEVANLIGQTPATIPSGLAHHYSLLGNAPVDLITGASGQVLGLTGSNIAWSTNATTPTITVSPTTNTTYNCTVTSGTQTCTSAIDITVNPQQTYFADADGDGYGNPDVVVQDCNIPVGYVTDNSDCNDNNAAVFAASTETCNGLDDDCDGQVDEGLTVASISATSVTTAFYPTCSGNALKSANLNNGTNSDLIEGNGLDLWYSLTAQYNTLRAGLSAAFGDNEIRLYSYNNGCFELIETEHEVYTTTSVATGNQILISDDLIPGQTYYIAVHNISGAINPSAKMCFNHFVGTTCDHYYSNNTGIYNNVCTSFKAQYKGNATNYIFDVLSATQNNANLNITPWSYTTTTANSVVPRLGTLFPVNMSASAKVYTLRIPVIYAIPDAAGNYTSITANATTTCTVTLNAELPVALRAADRCPNTKNTTSSISIDRTICGALRYEWEFTQQLPSVQPAVTVLGGLNTTVFFLNNVPGMGTGKTYNVRVRPIHTNGEVGSWGTVQCLKTGTAGMVLENHPGSAGAGEWANSGTEEWANNYSPEQEERFTLYPNPTNTGRFILTASNASDEEVMDIKMMDITGKMVYKTQVVMNGNAVEIEFGSLASGVYVVMVGEERLRLVIQ
jgi:hypothetical protein